MSAAVARSAADTCTRNGGAAGVHEHLHHRRARPGGVAREFHRHVGMRDTHGT